MASLALEIKLLTYKDIQAYTAGDIADYFGIERGTFSQAYGRKVREAKIGGNYSVNDPLSKEAMQRLSFHFSRISENAKAISEEIKLHPLDADKSLRVAVSNGIQRQSPTYNNDRDTDIHIQTYKDKIQGLNTDIQTYKDKYNDIQIQIQKHIQEKTDTNTSIHTYIQNAEQLQRQIQVLKDKIQTQTDTILQLKDTDNYKNVVSANTELSTAKMERDSFEQKYQASTQETALWKGQLNQLRDEMTVLLKTIYDKEAEIQRMAFQISQKDIDTERQVRETETAIRLSVGEEIKKAQSEWDTQIHTTIHTYKESITNLETENAQLKLEIKQIAKSNTEGYLKIEMTVLAAITGLSLIGFMIFQGIKTRDFFVLTDSVGKAAGETSATIFAICFAFFGLALTIALPMSNEEMAKKVWFDFLPVRTLPLLVFSIICFFINIYVNSDKTDEFTGWQTWVIINFKSFLTPFAEFCFGFILLTLRNKREDFIKLIDLLK